MSLPDDSLRKQRQDLSETEAPKTGGFASLQPKDADNAVQVCREQDPLVTCRVSLRLEPEYGQAPKRPPRRLDIPARDS